MFVFVEDPCYGGLLEKLIGLEKNQHRILMANAKLNFHMEQTILLAVE